MNSATAPQAATLTWQQQLAGAITQPAVLLELLQLPSTWLEPAQRAAQQFPLRVPRSFIARMQLGNARDPLLQQVLPLGVELDERVGYSLDPLGERAVNPLPGLLHKYHGRVLLTVASACAINCRFCFRRHFPYADNSPGMAGWERALAYIARDASISEVILSGGDPLVASDSYLCKLVAKIAAIPHVKILRVHTRLPIVLPARVTDALARGLTQSRLQPVLVTHCNHPQEIDATVSAALQKLRVAGITLLNQTVLLKGVNDSVVTLLALSRALFASGALPYYLHLLDKVQGVAHFEVSEACAKQLQAQLIEQLPGYLVPRLVREVPGAPAKMPVQ